MPIIEIPYGEWLPSAPTYANPGCLVANNVIPAPGGAYMPFRQAQVTDDTTSGSVKGARLMFDNSGNSVIVGGTDDSLFIRRSTVSETQGMTAIGEGEAWDFCQFNDFVIATGAGNSPQYLSDIDSDDTWSALSGSPPMAKRCARVNEFVMLGNITGAPSRLQWSAFNSPTSSWAADRLTQAGFVDLPVEFGAVQKIVGGRYAMVFQERALHRLTYVGPPLVWRADVVSSDRGLIAPFSVATIGYLSFYLARDGFYVTNGSTTQPIGNQRVNQYFLDTVNQNRLSSIHSAVDWQNEAIVWSYATQNSNVNDKAIIYSWAQDRWSSADIQMSWLAGATNDGVDIEGLDALYGNLDNIPYSLDSDIFKARGDVLAGFTNEEDIYLVDVNGDYVTDVGGNLILSAEDVCRYVTFTGLPAEATWETGEAQPSPGQRVHISGAYPLVQTLEPASTFGLKLTTNFGASSYTPQTAIGFGGFAPVRGEGQTVAIKHVIPANTDWSDAQGVQIEYRGAGMR